MACNTTFKLAPILEKEKLATNNENYADWVRTLRFVLGSANEYVLDVSLPEEPATDAPKEERNVYATNKDDNIGVVSHVDLCGA